MGDSGLKSGTSFTYIYFIVHLCAFCKKRQLFTSCFYPVIYFILLSVCHAKLTNPILYNNNNTLKGPLQIIKYKRNKLRNNIQ